MKALLVTETIYHKRIEYTSPGTYTFKATKTGACDVILVGAGGGGAYAASWNTWFNEQLGGQGGMITGQINVTAGQSYTIVIGAGGNGLHDARDDGAGGTASSGGNSTAFGNTAGGGAGAFVHTGYFDSYGNGGAGGGVTTVSGFVGSAGATGSTANRYGSYGGGGISNGGSAAANKGKNGYCRLEFVSDSSDYTYTSSRTSAKVVKDGTTYKAFNV